MAADDFNSDNLVFSDPPEPSPSYARIGQKSIDRIFEDAASDRVSTKKLVKRLQFLDGGIAPGTRVTQTLWVRRLECTRQAWGQDINKPYSGDDLVRFFAAIIPKMAISSDKTAPQKGTILRGLGILLAYGHFKWSDFKMQAHESARFKVFLEQAITDGKIRTGTWKRRTWIGFAVLSRLLSSFLSYRIKQGTTNWDIEISKCLSVVLLSALGARSGDVTRSMHYKGQEFLQWRHVDLHLVGSQPVLANIRATITLEFRKGHKMSDNEETRYYFSPLGSTEHNHMCPIAWLLVHALRHSLVVGETLQDVLDRAFARTDRQIEWLYPNRPVVAAFSRSPAHRVDLDKPGTPDQVKNTTKEMGVIAGMLDRTYPHALRLGYARDVAQLPISIGNNIEHVRQSLGHTAESAFSGVTDQYIGGLDAEIHTQRAQHSLQPRGNVVRFATSSGEIESKATTTAKLKSGPTTTTPLPEVSRQRRPLADKDVNSPATKAPKAPARPLENIDPALLTSEDLADTAATIPASAAEELCSIVFPESAPDSSTDSDSNDVASDKNDRNLLSAFSDADVQAALRSLTDKAGAEEDEALFVTDGNPAPVYSTSEIFITTYSKVNEVSTWFLGKAWESADNDLIAETTEKLCMFGGSRDLPTPKIFKCSKTPGCQNSQYTREAVRDHESRCSPEAVERFGTSVSLADEVAKHACPYDGCNYKPSAGTDFANCLRKHIAQKHTFEPKRCEHGCDPEKLYDNAADYSNHQRRAHTPGYPASCTFPGCASTVTYSGRQILERHLNKAHKLEGFDQTEPYLPTPPPKLEYVANQICWVNECEAQPPDKEAMTIHLRTKKHGMTLAQAKASVRDNAQFQTVPGTHRPKAPKKRAPTSAQVERQQGIAQKKTKIDD